MSDKILDVKNLSVIFNTDGGRICALRDLSLFVKRGEILAVVGESGCGKSVLCKTVMGLLPRIAEITKGQILINGKDVVQLTDQEHCAIRGVDISMVFQDPMTSLDPTYTIGAQIVESIRVHDKSIAKETAQAKAIELMDTVGIERAAERFGSYPWMLSGGMRQRCVLAMALAQEPALLIADEPTTALDVTVQSEILDLLLKLRDEKGMSILFITHDLGVVARVADRVAIMYAGKIVEEGLAPELYKNPVHPYTWGLLHALPAFAENGTLFPIPGNPPNIPEGFEADAFAVRNKYALRIDYEQAPPFFDISPTHKAATWLADPRAPKVEFSTDSDRTKAEAVKPDAGVDKPSILQVRNLSHNFKLGRRSIVQAVRNVSFEIREGEMFALVGESGSGKSTLARCILGLHKIQQGQILYDENYIPDRRRIGYVSQDPGAALDPKMTVRNLIAEPMEILKLYSSKKEVDTRVRELLQEVGLDEILLDRYPTELSGGQKQRVSIARAYSMEPSLIVADEPLASLDVSIQAQIAQLFASLKEKHNTAMLFIAHDLSMVEFISDRVGVMCQGELVEVAETKELFASPKHPYTKALLSAVPVPDPDYERGRRK